MARVHQAVKMSRQTPQDLACVLGVPLLFFFLAGCGGGESGPPRAAVEGRVTYEGTPLKRGIIVFVPAEGTSGPKTSASIVDGAFKLDADGGPLVGRHTVEIEALDETLAPDDEQAIARMKAEGIKRVDVIKLPPVYNRNSKLTADIKPEQDNTLTFSLTAKGE